MEEAAARVRQKVLGKLLFRQRFGGLFTGRNSEKSSRSDQVVGRSDSQDIPERADCVELSRVAARVEVITCYMGLVSPSFT